MRGHRGALAVCFIQSVIIERDLIQGSLFSSRTEFASYVK